MRLLVRSSAPSLNSFLAAALHSTPGTTTDQSDDITNNNSNQSARVSASSLEMIKCQQDLELCRVDLALIILNETATFSSGEQQIN